jgi:hypothetical protein
MVDGNTKQILARWQFLEEGSGLRRAAQMSRILWIVALLLVAFVGYAAAFRLNPILIAAAALVAGWMVAERNALRSRQAQWPIFRKYLDWNRIRQDLNDGA